MWAIVVVMVCLYRISPGAVYTASVHHNPGTVYTQAVHHNPGTVCTQTVHHNPWAVYTKAVHHNPRAAYTLAVHYICHKPDFVIVVKASMSGDSGAIAGNCVACEVWSNTQNCAIWGGNLSSSQSLSTHLLLVCCYSFYSKEDTCIARIACLLRFVYLIYNLFILQSTTIAWKELQRWIQILG
jgi:hypothetical protein